MTATSKLADQIRAGETVFGTWFTIPHLMVAETLAQGGFDFLLLDGEHSPVPPDTASCLLPATDLHGTPVIYRVRTNSVDLIRGALDGGVRGVMVPMIENAEDARKALNAAKYPPKGKRGIGPWRASNYYEDYLRYLDEANDSTIVVLQIESAAAVEKIDSIASLDGIDVLFVGPADMAASMGLKVGEKHDKMTEAVARVAAAGKKYRKALGIDATSLEYLTLYRNMGFSFFTYGMDTSYLLDSARAASRTVRAHIGQKT